MTFGNSAGDGMAMLFVSPHLVDLVLAFTVAEAIFLIWRKAAKRRTPRPPTIPALSVIVMLLPGICLMLGLRAALAGVAWPWLPVALLASLIAHVADARSRWSRCWP
jgi:hypothetical protein